MDDIHDFLEGNKIKILYIGTRFCSTCQALFPKIEELAKNLDFANLMRVEIDEVREVASAFQVLSAPTILHWRKKNFFWRKSFIKNPRLGDFFKKFHDHEVFLIVFCSRFWEFPSRRDFWSHQWNQQFWAIFCASLGRCLAVLPKHFFS